MIDFRNVSKAFGTQTVLDDVSFRVHPGERVGVVGPNGAGKSTLFGLLTGDLSPEKGECCIPSQLSVGYLRQQLNSHQIEVSILEYAENAVPELRTVQEQIHSLEASLAGQSEEEKQKSLLRLGDLQSRFEHLGGYDLQHRAEKTLCGLGFAAAALREPFRSFSGGWQMRAELARTLVARPDLLFLDEPTNYLDLPAVEWLRDYLRGYSGTLLLISHDRYLLNSLTKVTLEVAGGRVTRYPGNYDFYVADRQNRYEQLLAAHKNQDRKRQQIERFVDRFRSKSSKATQVQSRVKMLDKMEEIRLPMEIVAPPKIRLAAPSRCGAEVARLEDAGLSYDGQRWIFRHENLTIERGLKVAVVGLNGMGKTTLLRVLAGKLLLSEGKYLPGHNVQLGYLAQDFADVMDPEKSVWAITKEASPDLSDSETRSLLGSFRFSGNSVEKKVAVLSGGEKMRLGLARLLANPPNFIVLDEPTTHLDIDSRKALEKALRDFEGTLCFVSHDVTFVSQVADTIFAVGDGKISRYYGNYEYYQEKLALAAAAESAEATGKQPAPQDASTAGVDRRAQKKLEAERRQALYKLRKPLEKQLHKLETSLEALEKEKQSLIDLLASPEPPKDFAAASCRLNELQAKIDSTSEEWEAVALELEEIGD
jgi:ATP-binding cassette subfamily F protein 3